MTNLSKGNLVPKFTLEWMSLTTLLNLEATCFFRTLQGTGWVHQGVSALGLQGITPYPSLWDSYWRFRRNVSQTFSKTYLSDSFSAATIFLTSTCMLQRHLTLRGRGSGLWAQTDLGLKSDLAIYSQCVALDSTLRLAEPVTSPLKMRKMPDSIVVKIKWEKCGRRYWELKMLGNLRCYSQDE